MSISNKLIIVSDNSITSQTAEEVAKSLKKNYDVFLKKDFSKIDWEPLKNCEIFIAISPENLILFKSQLVQEAIIRKLRLINLIHPYADVHSDVGMGVNILINHSTTIKPYTSIGNNVHIDHDCFVGSRVIVNKNAHIGTNSRLNPNVSIGSNTILKENITVDEGVMIGNYCEILKRNFICSMDIANRTLILENVPNPITTI